MMENKRAVLGSKPRRSGLPQCTRELHRWPFGFPHRVQRNHPSRPVRPKGPYPSRVRVPRYSVRSDPLSHCTKIWTPFSTNAFHFRGGPSWT